MLLIQNTVQKWNPKQNKTKKSPILKIAGSISPGWTSQQPNNPLALSQQCARRIFVWDLLGNVENILFRLSLLALGLFSHVRCESSHYNQVVKKKKTFLPFQKSRKVFSLSDASGITEKFTMRNKSLTCRCFCLKSKQSPLGFLRCVLWFSAL